MNRRQWQLLGADSRIRLFLFVIYIDPIVLMIRSRKQYVQVQAYFLRRSDICQRKAWGFGLSYTGEPLNPCVASSL